MTRRTFRIALVTLGLCTLAACIVNLSFDMQKTIAVQSQAGVASVSQSQLVNLSDYSEINDHKDSIKSLDLDSADVTVATVNPANKATTVTGTVKLRKVLTDPPANDVAVGSLTNFSLAQGTTVKLPGSPALDAFLLQQLQTAGSFYVIIDGSLDQAPADLVLNVTLHASLGYDTGLF